mmetsp:Transcript_131308/g.280839  ORF Transcript_131308/g.280839 Transcript_131308/m.280839 type:complete len:233 (+) Transcript_131308:225-923(+)
MRRRPNPRRPRWFLQWRPSPCRTWPCRTRRQASCCPPEQRESGPTQQRPRPPGPASARQARLGFGNQRRRCGPCPFPWGRSGQGSSWTSWGSPPSERCSRSRGGLDSAPAPLLSAAASLWWRAWARERSPRGGAACRCGGGRCRCPRRSASRSARRPTTSTIWCSRAGCPPRSFPGRAAVQRHQSRSLAAALPAAVGCPRWARSGLPTRQCQHPSRCARNAECPLTTPRQSR